MLFDGTLTFFGFGNFQGNITLSGTMNEDATVTITINGVDYTGTVADPGSGVLAVTIEDGENELTLYEDGKDTDFYVAGLGAGDFPVKIVQVGGHEPK